MGLFFAEEEERFTEERKTGFPRYREVLEGGWKDFIKVGFITLVFHIPLAAGMVYAVLTKSLLVALLSGVLGGAIAGPGYACLVDLILRRLRDDLADWWLCWKRSMAQNRRDALLPGICQSTFLGLIVFAFALALWGAAPLTPATVLLLLLATLLVIAVMTVWWPQVVLFESTPARARQKNILLFLLKYRGKALLSALLQLLWWAILFLFLPWTAFVVPVLGIWYILFLALFLLYRPLDEAFRIEEQLRARFPEKFENKMNTEETEHD